MDDIRNGCYPRLQLIQIIKTFIFYALLVQIKNFYKFCKTNENFYLYFKNCFKFLSKCRIKLENYSLKQRDQ